LHFIQQQWVEKEIRVRACIRCKKYIIINPNDPTNQNQIKSFERAHPAHTLITVELDEIKNFYEKTQKLDDLSASESELTSLDKDKHKKVVKKKTLEQYRYLINNILDVILEIDSDGTFIYCSPQTFNLFGYQPEELIGLNAFTFIHPEDVPKIIKKLEEAINKGELRSAIYRTRHKDGHYILVSAKGGVFKENGNFRFISVIREVEEKNKFDEKVREYLLKYENLEKDLENKYREKILTLKDSDKKFQHLFQTSPNAIIISNFGGTIIDCNSATYNLFKYKKEDLVGKKFLQIMALPSNTLSILHNVYEQLIKGQDVEQSEIQGYNKEGKLIWFSYTATLIRLHDEILIQVIAQDITEKKLRGDT
jgi:PAS domain S-box-containing protein